MLSYTSSLPIVRTFVLFRSLHNEKNDTKDTRIFRHIAWFTTHTLPYGVPLIYLFQVLDDTSEALLFRDTICLHICHPEGERPTQTTHHTLSPHGFAVRVRICPLTEWYFTVGSTVPKRTASKPPTYATQ